MMLNELFYESEVLNPYWASVESTAKTNLLAVTGGLCPTVVHMYTG